MKDYILLSVSVGGTITTLSFGLDLNGQHPEDIRNAAHTALDKVWDAIHDNGAKPSLTTVEKTFTRPI